MTIFDHIHYDDHQAGYTTMYAGKYLNQVRCQYSTEEDFDVEDKNDDVEQYIQNILTMTMMAMEMTMMTTMMKFAQYGRRAGGGLGHVPNGWTWWAGLVGNSR